MAISNSMAAAAAAAAESPVAPTSSILNRSDPVVAQVAQGIFGQFHVHYDVETTDVHIVHVSQIAHPEISECVNQIAQAVLTPAQIQHKQQLASVGEQKAAKLQPEIHSLEGNIQKIDQTIAKLDLEIARCDTEINDKTAKNKLTKLLSKNEEELAQLKGKKDDLLARRSQLLDKKTELVGQKNTTALLHKQSIVGSQRAQSAITVSHQTAQFRQNLQAKLVDAEQRYKDLGCREHNGNVVFDTPQGHYDLGLSPAAFKMMLAVSLMTDDVAKDRIIRLHTSSENKSTLDTHQFYQISAKGSDAAALVHKHGKVLASGGKGEVFKALELISKEVRVLKEMKDPDEDTIEEMKLEYDMSCAANPDNMRPGLAQKPHACFDLRREGFGGIGLVFDLYNGGDVRGHISTLSFQDQAQGLLALFNANQSLSDSNLLHLDIKPENVFVNVHQNDDKRSVSMVVADFDGLWDLSLSTDEFIDLLFDQGAPASSDNSRTLPQMDRLDDIRKEISAVRKEIARANPGSERAQCLEQKLDALVDSYKTTAKLVQSWGVAYTALQILCQEYSNSFKGKEALILKLEQRVEKCKDMAEKTFLQSALMALSPILHAPLPEVDRESGKIKSPILTADQALRDVQVLVDRFMNGKVRTAAAAAAAASPDASESTSAQATKGRRPSPPPAAARDLRAGDSVLRK